MIAPISAAQESSVNSMVNDIEPSKAMDYEKALRQAETDKIITKALALQHKEESEEESEKGEKKDIKPKTLYFRKEYGNMES